MNNKAEKELVKELNKEIRKYKKKSIMPEVYRDLSLTYTGIEDYRDTYISEESETVLPDVIYVPAQEIYKVEL